MANTKITADNIAANAITASSITDGTITAAKLAANSVDSDQYVDGSIDAIHIADGAITSAKLDTNIAIAGTLGVTGATTMTGLTVDGTGDFNIGTENVGIDITSTDAGAYIGLNDNNATGFYLGTNAGIFYLLDTGNSPKLKINNNGDISFYEDTGTTAKLFWDASAESLGIGTSSPSKGLHLNFSNDFAAIRFQNTANAKVWDLTPSIPDLANSGFSLYNVTDNTVPLHVDNSGNVGIGTSSPSSLYSTANQLVIGDGSADVGMTIYTPSTGSGRIFFADGLSSGAQYAAFISYNHALESMLFGTGSTGTADLTIDSNGNVGIGTTSPADTLHVKKSSTVVGEAILTVEGGASGYGTGISFQSVLNGGSLAEMARIVADGEASWNTTASTQDAGLRFYTTGDGTSAIRMRIDASGRVGINRTPAISNSQLEVGGADNVPLINVEASGATGGMGIGSTGLQLFHGSTARMKINSGGQITVPYQPSFLAYPSASYTASGGSAKATFASTRHNVGSHYNTATSTFTAPVAGNYLFVCDLAMQSSVSALSYMGIGVRKNNTGDIYFGGWGHKADGRNNTTAAQYAKTSSQIIMYLAQGDYVEPYIELSGSHTVLSGSDGAYTRFCGQLLS